MAKVSLAGLFQGLPRRLTPVSIGLVKLTLAIGLAAAVGGCFGESEPDLKTARKLMKDRVIELMYQEALRYRQVKVSLDAVLESFRIVECPGKQPQNTATCLVVFKSPYGNDEAYMVKFVRENDKWLIEDFRKTVVSIK